MYPVRSGLHPGYILDSLPVCRKANTDRQQTTTRAHTRTNCFWTFGKNPVLFCCEATMRHHATLVMLTCWVEDMCVVWSHTFHNQISLQWSIIKKRLHISCLHCKDMTGISSIKNPSEWTCRDAGSMTQHFCFFCFFWHCLGFWFNHLHF